ncbi:hypothetical protein TH5_09130 [Thalassospira xianhensis MCCC 1A02616]|uniref:Uncharacterized protein n=1 Tax=Thalassospira xianhensis MCCC 1A02616 TaxID=1177929 RepID=A0A367UF99_9PROT|nr:hypothetical protein TH5_09130 [Thalassospira xianhensis MCCC 1A02616]
MVNTPPTKTALIKAFVHQEVHLAKQTVRGLNQKPAKQVASAEDILRSAPTSQTRPCPMNCKQEVG